MASVEQFAHALLFRCPQCSRPPASVCSDRALNLEQADAHWFNPRFPCGWTGDVVGVVAVGHWVEPCNGNAPVGPCDRGIPAEQLRKFKSYGRGGVGLRGLRERIAELGGKLEVQSEGNGSGTTGGPNCPVRYPKEIRR